MQKVALVNSTTDIFNKTQAKRQDRHQGRKRSGSILTTPELTWGSKGGRDRDRHTFNKLSDDADDVRVLQLHHDAEFLLELSSKLLVHGLFESLDGHFLHSPVLVLVLALQYLAVVTLDTPQHSRHNSSILLIPSLLMITILILINVNNLNAGG